MTVAKNQMSHAFFIRAYWYPITPYRRAGGPEFRRRARSSPRHARAHRCLPVLAVEWFRRDRGKIYIVEAAHIDVDLVRIGARHVERMDAAVFAKRVLCGPGVELIRRQIVRAADELEPFRRHDQMQKSFLGAYRAVAIGHAREIGRDAEPHASAMASAFHRLEHGRPISPLFPLQTTRIAPDRAQALPAQDGGRRARSRAARAGCAGENLSGSETAR